MPGSWPGNISNVTFQVFYFNAFELQGNSTLSCDALHFNEITEVHLLLPHFLVFSLHKGISI